MTEDELIEALVDKEHAGWSAYMAYLFEKCEHNPDGSLTIPPGYVAALQKQIDTPYAELSEQEKQYDRDEVSHILPIIEEYTAKSAQIPNTGPIAEPALPPLPNPTPEQIEDPTFQIARNVIKSWDVDVPEHYFGYCGAMGSHVMHPNALAKMICDLDLRVAKIEGEIFATIVGDRPLTKHRQTLLGRVNELSGMAALGDVDQSWFLE